MHQPTQQEINRYIADTLIVESLLEFHPEFHPSKPGTGFTDEEVAAFMAYYLPDWDAAGDAPEVLTSFLTERPEIRSLAESVFSRWCDVHGVESKPQSSE